jgi:AraC-like DNA-binding protein
MEQQRSTERWPDGQRAQRGTVACGALRAVGANTSPIDRHSARALAGHPCGPVALALVEDERFAPPTARDQLLQAAAGHVEEMLGDPELTPADVARRVAISPRHLHRLFAGRGTTFGRWLLERRLERARAALLDGTQAHRTIGDIAYSVGFRDPSYFARAFKTRYATTPRTARKTAFVELAVAA